MCRFTGEHSFIHYDSEQSQPRKQRSEVQRHIQNRYSPWRRRPQSEGLKGEKPEPLKLAERPKPSPSVSISNQAIDSANDLPFQQRGLRFILPLTRPSATALQPHRPSQRLLQGAVYDAIGPGPQSLLQEGNSDPFKSYAIDVTPFVNQAIGYFRDVIAPQRYQPEVRSITPHSRALSYWQSFVHSLQITSVGNGVMTLLTTILTRDVNPAIGGTVLMYKGKLLQSTREALTGPRGSFSEVHLMILSLWACELDANNLLIATHHAEMLARFFGQLNLTRLIAINGALLEYTLAIDEFHTKLSGGPSYFGFPSFDLQPLLTQLACELDYPLTAVNISATHVFRAIPSLTEAFFQLRTVIQIDHFIDNWDRKFPESIFRQIDTVRLLCQARLSSSYHKLRSRLSEISPSDDQRADVGLIAAATMAALDWSRMFYVGNAYNKLPWLHLGALTDAIERYELIINDTFEMAQLKSALGNYSGTFRELRVDQTSGESSPATPPALPLNQQAIRARQELWLWTLYVGAHAEQTSLATVSVDSGTSTNMPISSASEATSPLDEDSDMKPGPPSPPGAGRYLVRFAQQAQNMELTDWETDVRPVLEKFLYSDRMRPRAEEWVREVL